MSGLGSVVTAAGVATCALFSGGYLLAHPEGPVQSWAYGEEKFHDLADRLHAHKDCDPKKKGCVPRARRSDAFLKYDKNGDGILSPAELNQAKKDVQAGKLSKKEFKKLQGKQAAMPMWAMALLGALACLLFLGIPLCYYLSTKGKEKKAINHVKGHLRLKVLNANNLKNVDSGRRGDVSDAYCRAKVGSEENHTATIQNNLNPVWNHESNGNLFIVSNGNLRCVSEDTEKTKEGDKWSGGWNSDGRIVTDGKGGAFIVSNGNLRHVTSAQRDGAVWSSDWKLDENQLTADGSGGLYIMSKGCLYHVTEQNKDGGMRWSSGWSATAMVYNAGGLFIISRGHLYKVTEQNQDGDRWSSNWDDKAIMTSDGDKGLYIHSRGHLYHVDSRHKDGDKWSGMWSASHMTFDGSALFVISHGNLYKVTKSSKDGELWSKNWDPSFMVSNGNGAVYICTRGNLHKLTAATKPDGVVLSRAWHAAAACFSQAEEKNCWFYDVDLQDANKNSLLLEVCDENRGKGQTAGFTLIGKATVDIAEFARSEGKPITKTVPLPTGGEVSINGCFVPLSSAESARQAAAASRGNEGAADAASPAAQPSIKVPTINTSPQKVSPSVKNAAAAPAAEPLPEPLPAHAEDTDVPASTVKPAATPAGPQVSTIVPPAERAKDWPPGLAVDIIRATDLPKIMSLTADKPYVIVSSSRARTKTDTPDSNADAIKAASNEVTNEVPVAGGSATMDPVWNTQLTLAPWAPGDDLTFTLAATGVGGFTKTYGKCFLKSEQFHPKAFEGEIEIVDESKGNEVTNLVPRLTVAVETALPHGWERATTATPDGRQEEYFYNYDLGTSVWEKSQTLGS